jgi:hypothetical protein
MIDIQQEQRARHTIATPSLDFAVQRSAEAATICESSQVVKISFAAQPLHRLPDFDQLPGSQNEQFELTWHLEVIESSG